MGLFESAIAQPQAQFGGEFLHEDLFAMAAAYLFHIVKNHPFIDGNKRVSFVMTDVLLRLNGYFLEVEPIEAHRLITGAMEKNEFRFPMIRDWIASVIKPLPREE